jgi:hypothetical protein
MRLGQPKQRSRAGVRAALGDLGAAKPSTSSVIKRCSFPEALESVLDVLVWTFWNHTQRIMQVYFCFLKGFYSTSKH